jgi:hypothetical protein
VNCPRCGSLPDEIELQSEQVEPDRNEFPPAFRDLRELNSSLSPGSLWPCVLKCPGCGAYFRLTQRIPGGSEDVFRTWIYLSLERVSPSEAKATLELALASRRRCGGMDEEARRLERVLASETEELERRKGEGKRPE